VQSGWTTAQTSDVSATGLLGSVFYVKLQQKREKTVWQLLWQRIKVPKVSPDRGLHRTNAHRFVIIVTFATFREINPFLCHFNEKGANAYIACLLGYCEALGRQPPSRTRPINLHRQ
jgi:hypothetical protein